MDAYYTGKGDDGTSGLMGGKRAGKDSPIFEALGNLDELNCIIGICIMHSRDNATTTELAAVQNDIFSIAAVMAAAESGKRIGKVKAPDPARLESAIGMMGKNLPRLGKFVMPQGTMASSHLQLARAVCRRAERSIVRLGRGAKEYGSALRYMNRLSSFLYVAALHENMTNGVKEKSPTY